MDSSLLKQIESGRKLKKAVTNDRSAPTVDSKPKGGPGGGGGGGPIHGGPPPSIGRSAGSSIASAAAGAPPMGMGPPQLGGLFAGGMPALKKAGGATLGRADSAPSAPPPAPRPHPSSNGPPPPPRINATTPSSVPPPRTNTTPSSIPPPVAPRNNIPPAPPSRPGPAPSPPTLPSRPSVSATPQPPSGFATVRGTAPPAPARTAPPPPPRAPVATPDTLSVPARPGGMPRSLSGPGPMTPPAPAGPTYEYEMNGRWKFKTDLPPPRQWPSGLPGSGNTNSHGVGYSNGSVRGPIPPPTAPRGGAKGPKAGGNADVSTFVEDSLPRLQRELDSCIARRDFARCGELQSRIDAVEKLRGSLSSGYDVSDEYRRVQDLVRGYV
ncbi:hypothetical protein SeMB42_g05259 [Synchytrium endobioticum]|uniref:WH2 domain-containing protein n=1 Tax=Synchytrium endobioticum TaxID=286115 RepID=A0A507D1B4_9FUNG|nr:hypothetical protein SeMB42_g05259 [Synchytrium endobioticum]TPX45242.1 hypothetical protein SeLEV6574_g03981 [Synchytrium endobioticum]